MSEPTSSDLLALARDEIEPAVRAELLAGAERSALTDATMGPSDLLALAAVHAEDGHTDHAQRCIESALDRGPGQIWIHRNAATLLQQLGEDQLAADSLLQCEAEFGESSAAGYLWRLLAQGWVESLGDDDGAMRCLARPSRRSR